MKVTEALKKIACITAAFFLITSSSFAYPMDPVYNDGILWTYGEHMKADDILYDNGDRLYVNMNDSVYSIPNDLSGSFRYEKPFVWDEYYGHEGGENVEDSRITHKDHKLCLDGIELLDVTSYEEETNKSFNEYFKDDSNYNPEDANIGVWASEFVVDENTRLVDMTVITQGYIPAPYTPRYNFIFLIKDNAATLLDIPQDRSLENVVKREDKSLVLDLSVRYFKSNTGRDIGVLDSSCSFTLLSKSLGIYNLELIRAFDDSLYFEVFMPEYYFNKQDSSARAASGIYKYDFGSDKPKILAKSESEEDDYYESKENYYVSSERNIYAIRNGGIVNVLTGKKPDDRQFDAKEKIYTDLESFFDKSRSDEDKSYSIENGCSWYIKEGNLYRQSGGKLKMYSGKDFIPEVDYEWVCKLFKDEAKNLYVLKDSGLYVLEPGKDKPKQIEDLATYKLGELGYDGSDLYVDDKGVVWFLTNSGILYSYKDGKLGIVKDYGSEGYEHLENFTYMTYRSDQDGTYLLARKREGLNLEILVLTIADGQPVEKKYEFDVSGYSCWYTLDKLNTYDDPESNFSYLTTYLSGWQKCDDSIFIRTENGVIRIKGSEMKFLISDDVEGGDLSFVLRGENEVIFSRDYGFVSAKIPAVGDVIGHYRKSEGVYSVNGVNLPIYKVDGSDGSYICAEALVLAGYSHEWDAKNKVAYITEGGGDASKTPELDDQGDIYYSDVAVKFLGADVDSFNIGGYSLVSVDKLKKQ